jgi:hypothetical protein
MQNFGIRRFPVVYVPAWEAPLPFRFFYVYHDAKADYTMPFRLQQDVFLTNFV